MSDQRPRTVEEALTAGLEATPGPGGIEVVAAEATLGRIPVRLAGGQWSHVMSAPAAADALPIVPEDVDGLLVGAETALWWMDRPSRARPVWRPGASATREPDGSIKQAASGATTPDAR